MREARTRPRPPRSLLVMSESSLSPRRWWWIAGGAAVVVLAVVAVFFVINRGGDAGGGSTTITGVAEVNETLKGVTEVSGTIGNPKAPVEIIELADLRCPACQQFSLNELPATVENLVKTGKVRFTREMWPITGGTDGTTAQAFTAAYAGLAARDQNKMWKFTELFYANQGSEADDYVTDEYLTALATKAGLDVDRFTTDRANVAQYEKDLNRTLDLVSEHGFNGTPSFVVIGPKGTEVLPAGVPTSADLEAVVKRVSA